MPVERAHLDRLIDGAPAWLAADRTAGFAAFEALPGETNLLYTTYLDLRPAELEDATILGHHGRGRRRPRRRSPTAWTASSRSDDGVVVGGSLSSSEAEPPASR